MQSFHCMLPPIIYIALDLAIMQGKYLYLVTSEFSRHNIMGDYH